MRHILHIPRDNAVEWMERGAAYAQYFGVSITTDPMKAARYGTVTAPLGVISHDGPRYDWVSPTPAQFEADLQTRILADTPHLLPSPSLFVGFHARANHHNRPEDVSYMRQAGAETVKISSAAGPETIPNLKAALGWGRQDVTDRVVMRLFHSYNAADGMPSPADLVAANKPDMERHVRQGVRRVEVLNEMNLFKEGAREFPAGTYALYWARVMRELKSWRPHLLVGSTALSPIENGPLGIDYRTWYQQMRDKGVYDQADFICWHSYWSDGASLYAPVFGGRDVKIVRRDYPHKELWITEAGSPLNTIDPDVKAEQYRDFIRMAKANHAHVHWYVVSGTGWDDWAFVDESGHPTALGKAYLR